jgi:alkanesulfonate monooxygenase SsuD/methylene tetrahydromethanopterin reductase-like flavin-dependent oxidoreductase (luciferase family)
MIMGLGRGNRGALYEYDAYRVDQNETAERLVEMEDLLVKLWSGGSVVHDGKHYQVAIPTLRPQPFSRPHPALIRSVAQDASFVEMARQRRPVLAAFGSETELARKLELYRQTMRNDGRDDDEIQNCLDNSWTWRHVFVAETNAEAERLGLPAFRAMRSERQKDSEKLHSAIGRVTPPSPGGEEGFIYGTPERVCETIAKMEESGIGGVVLRFRLGTMPADVAENNLRMFMKDVAPNFQTGRQAAFSSV